MEIIHAIGGYLFMRRVEYDHKEVPISMDEYFIHGCNILSMDLNNPWVPCNTCAVGAGDEVISESHLYVASYTWVD